MPEYKRGDVILIPFPYIQNYKKGKTRPALIIQNDIANEYSNNLIVALISSAIPSKIYPMHFFIDIQKERQSGLTTNSIVKTEIIITVPKKVVLKKLGSFSSFAMQSVNECIKKSLSVE